MPFGLEATLRELIWRVVAEARKARVVGFNHVALEVGDIEAALDFYSCMFDFELRSKSDSMAFINGIEIVEYDNIQFTKAPNVLRGMGLAHLSKNETAIKELTDKAWRPPEGADGRLREYVTRDDTRRDELLCAQAGRGRLQ